MILEKMTYIIETLIRLYSHVYIKLFAAGAIGITQFFFGSLYTEAIFATIILMIFDTLTALVAAYSNGDQITSKKFSRSVKKGAIYLICISSAYFTDITIPGEFIQSTMIAFVACTELISILENAGKMGFHTPKVLLNQLKLKRDGR